MDCRASARPRRVPVRGLLPRRATWSSRLTTGSSSWIGAGSAPTSFYSPTRRASQLSSSLLSECVLHTFGASSYAPYMALLLLVHGVACVLLYVLARRRVGPWAALAPPLRSSLSSGQHGSTCCGRPKSDISARLPRGWGWPGGVERRDNRGDAAASALLAVSLLLSSVGLGMVVLAGVLLVLERPRAWRRLWIAGVPLTLYAAWHTAYGVSGRHQPQHWPHPELPRPSAVRRRRVGDRPGAGTRVASS